MCSWKRRCSQESSVFKSFWKEERVISALSNLKRPFHHWRTRYENCLERHLHQLTLLCRTQQMRGSTGSERLLKTDGAGPASSSSSVGSYR